MTVRKWPEAVYTIINKLQPALKDGQALHDRLFYGWPVIAEIPARPIKPGQVLYAPAWYIFESVDGINIYNSGTGAEYTVETIGM